MDPLTQGAVGAALPQAVSRRGDVAIAGLLGFLAGMTPDLDVLIRSSTDPFVALEYHRQFTHSLIFIPFGSLLCALVLHPLLGRRRGLSLRQTVLYCTLGFATHALLDACTNYGTLLLWPFSDLRVAWNNVSIIDPLFTLPILGLIALAAVRKAPFYARVALVWGLGYLALGLYQQQVAEGVGRELAAQRGHVIRRIEAQPSFGNLLLWRVTYETDTHFHIDAVRAGFRPEVYPGEARPRLDLARDFPWLKPDTQQARDVERFRWFSRDYLSPDKNDPSRIVDIRFSVLPNVTVPMFSIALDPTAGPDTHAAYLFDRGEPAARIGALWEMLAGDGSSAYNFP